MSNESNTADASEIDNQLSAFMDGELETDASRFLFKRLDHDQALMDRWSRYHLVGEAMRGNANIVSSSSLASAISRQIEQEPAPEFIEQPSTAVAQSGSSAPRWLRPVAGMAVAATVAAVTIGVFTNPSNPLQDADPGIASTAAPATTVIDTPVTGNGPTTSNALVPSVDLTATTASGSATFGDNARLRSYVLRHAEVAGRGQRLTPFVLMVPPQADTTDLSAESDSEVNQSVSGNED